MTQRVFRGKESARHGSRKREGKNRELMRRRVRNGSACRLGKVDTPKVRGWGQKFDSDSLPSVSRFTDKNHPAFLLFLGDRILQNDHFTVVDFIGQGQQTTMGADDDGFADFLEFFPAVRTAMHLQTHLVKDTLATPRTDLNRAGHVLILGATRVSVNCPNVQVSRNSNAFAGPLAVPMVRGGPFKKRHRCIRFHE